MFLRLATGHTGESLNLRLLLYLWFNFFSNKLKLPVHEKAEVKSNFGDFLFDLLLFDIIIIILFLFWKIDFFVSANLASNLKTLWRRDVAKRLAFHFCQKVFLHYRWEQILSHLSSWVQGTWIFLSLAENAPGRARWWAKAG